MCVCDHWINLLIINACISSCLHPKLYKTNKKVKTNYSKTYMDKEFVKNGSINYGMKTLYCILVVCPPRNKITIL